jgi:hypothetical protein
VWRFYLIASLIVVAAGSVLFAHRLAAGRRPEAGVKASPRPARGNANAGFVVTPPPFFDGEGSWVLSALPDCFDQLSSTEGPTALVRRHVPPARFRIVPGTTLHAGNCTVYVRSNDVWVFRGADRLRVPPDARLFRAPSGTTLVYDHGGRTEVRVYHALPAWAAAR